jgi:alpha-L-fucosidase
MGRCGIVCLLAWRVQPKWPVTRRSAGRPARLATRAWKVYGEGPSVTDQAPRGQFGGARDVRPYTAEDFRFTAKGDTVYAFMMGWPEGGKAVIKTLAQGSEHYPEDIARVELRGSRGSLTFSRDTTGLEVKLPETRPNDYGICPEDYPQAGLKT